MSRWRTFLPKAAVTAAIAAIVVSGLSVVPVAAKAAKPKSFSGAAPGSVTCTMSAKVLFSPPLTESGGGTSASSVDGVLVDCHATDSTVAITQAKVTGLFASSPLDCATLSATGVPATLILTWKGTVNGAVGASPYAGRATFAPSTISGTTITGSFAGDAAIDIGVPLDLAALCQAKKGIAAVTLTGTVMTTTKIAGMGGYSVVPPTASATRLTTTFAVPSITCPVTGVAAVDFNAGLTDAAVDGNATSAGAGVSIECADGHESVLGEAYAGHRGVSTDRIVVGTVVTITVAQTTGSLSSALVDEASSKGDVSSSTTALSAPVLAVVAAGGSMDIPTFQDVTFTDCQLDGRALGKEKHLDKTQVTGTDGKVQISTGKLTVGGTTFAATFKRST